MTFIEQIQSSPKWGEFEHWYVNQQVQDRDGTSWWRLHIEKPKYGEEIIFIDLPFEFQKGVFEKFLKDSGIELHQDNSGWCQIKKNNPHFAKTTDTFEEVLLWYFNSNELD